MYPNILRLCSACNNYTRNSTAYNSAYVMENLFTATSTIAGMVGGPLGTIISEQMSLGAFLLDEGVKIMSEHKIYYDELELLWAEIENSDTFTDEMSEKVNTLIEDCSSECMTYQYAKMYDAINEEFGWIFDLATEEEKEKLQMYDGWAYVLSKRGDDFLELYDKVYAGTEDMLVRENLMNGIILKWTGCENGSNPNITVAMG